jgi:phosphoserine phosphatase
MSSKKLAVFDIDKTLSREFLVTPIIKSEEESGLIASGTYAKSLELLLAIKSGHLEYEDAAHRLLVVHAEALKGQRVADIEKHTRDYLGKHAELFHSFSVPTMKLLRPTHELVVVTAEPEYMARAVAETLGMDGVLSSEYEVRAGVFTGKLAVSLAHRSEKRRLIGDLRPNIAFGDSAGDIEMLEHAHNAFCISPDAALMAKAQQRGWRVFDGDSDAEIVLSSIKECLGSSI